MEIEFDQAKRDETLAERGLDFLDAPRLFEGTFLTVNDTRFDYGEERWRTYGWIGDVAIAAVWTLRGDRRRIISMRRMHDEEVAEVGLDRP
ncbi:MAG: BrnT family toxin [Sphingomonadaceae bacterium]